MWWVFISRLSSSQDICKDCHKTDVCGALCYFGKAACFCQILTSNIFNFCTNLFGAGSVYVMVVSS